jgi:hypothetical protein
MGATLSKMWASLRSAFAGGAPPAGKNSSQQLHSQNTNTAVKDVESGTNTPPTKSIGTAVMPEIQKFEITEVCNMVLVWRGRWDGGGWNGNPAAVMDRIEGSATTHFDIKINSHITSAPLTLTLPRTLPWGDANSYHISTTLHTDFPSSQISSTKSLLHAPCINQTSSIANHHSAMAQAQLLTWRGSLLGS